MLVQVDAKNTRGAVLQLPLEDASAGFAIGDIEGLGPVKAQIISSSFANQDGTQYHTSRREERNIKFQIDLYPNYINQSVYDLRQKIYQFFMPKSEVRLTFMMLDGKNFDIKGRVETCEPAMFTAEPAMDISILCNDSDFVDLTEKSWGAMTTSGSQETELTYKGSVETSVIFEMNLNRNLDALTIYHRAPDGLTYTLEFVAPLLNGDKLTINTIRGSKGATLLRGGTTSSILHGISPQSKWLELQPGQNFVRLYATGAPILGFLRWIDRYGGL